MASIWYIDGQTTASLGVEDLKITFRNRAADEAVFTIPGDYLGTLGWTYGTRYAIKKGAANGTLGTATTVFAGRLVSVARAATGTDQRRTVRLLGGWHDLEQVVYTQNWKVGTANTSAARTRVILGVDDSGGDISFNKQLGNIVSCAINAGAAIQTGTITVENTLDGVKAIPRDEQVDLTCAEALNRVLAWCPDAQVWFDYAVAGNPAVNIVRRASCNAVSPVPSAADAESIECTPRHDLVVPGVVLFFEKLSADASGTKYKGVTTQVWPSGTSSAPPPFGALVSTLQLDGGHVRYLWQTLKTEALTLANLQSAATWQKWLPWLDGGANNAEYVSGGAPAISNLSFADVENPSHAIPSWPPVVDGKNCDHVLLEGEIPSWLDKKTCTVAISAEVSYETPSEKVVGRKISHTLTLTNAVSGLYNALAERESGETVPDGLAKKLYESLSSLHYEGRFVQTGEDPPAIATPGNKFKIADGRTDWETMNAVVQTVEWDVARGRTTVSFGPPEHLGPQDLFQYLQANRRRAPTRSLAEKTTSAATAGGDGVGGPSKTSDGTSGCGLTAKKTFAASTAANTPNVAIDGTAGTVSLTNVTSGTTTGLSFDPAATPEPFTILTNVTPSLAVADGNLLLVLVKSRAQLVKVSNALYSVTPLAPVTEIAPIAGSVCT